MGRDRTPYDVDLYSILGAARTASLEELKKAYHAGCKEHHPDKGGAEEEFKKIGMAWEVLQDLAKRAAYDKWSCFEAQYQAPKSPAEDVTHQQIGTNHLKVPPANIQAQMRKAGEKEVRELRKGRRNTVLGWQKNSQKISSGFAGKRKVLVAALSSSSISLNVRTLMSETKPG